MNLNSVNYLDLLNGLVCCEVNSIIFELDMRNNTRGEIPFLLRFRLFEKHNHFVCQDKYHVWCFPVLVWGRFNQERLKEISITEFAFRNELHGNFHACIEFHEFLIEAISTVENTRITQTILVRFIIIVCNRVFNTFCSCGCSIENTWDWFYDYSCNTFSNTFEESLCSSFLCALEGL